MSDELIITNLQFENIRNLIYEIRGQKVMIDKDLADMYEVEVSQLKRQVRRNIDRFPKDFMFELTPEEVSSLRCQNGTLKTGRGQHSKYAPFAFTEEGVAMLSGLLHSKVAIQVNINIMRAFVAVRQAVAALHTTDLRYEQVLHKVDQLHAYVEKLLHDQNDINEQQEQTNVEIAVQIEAINNALDQLRETKNEPRKRIGFKQQGDKKQK
ncbi:MAG: ORF6N domain-containing protein [Bacteroidales bacterium]|nr:ORF6N domain-containing protein [Bacteroidales bacterium]